MVNRIIRLAVTTALAILLIWRGSTFQSPEGTELITPVMSVFAGLFLFLTGLAICVKADGDLDESDVDDAVAAEDR